MVVVAGRKAFDCPSKQLDNTADTRNALNMRCLSLPALDCRGPIILNNQAGVYFESRAEFFSGDGSLIRSNEATDYTERILDAVSGRQEGIAPRLWAYEIRNSVLSGVRRKRISLADADEFLQSLSDLNITLLDPLAYNNVFAVAGRFGLTVYDAAYLDLAMREGIPIASLDKQLLQGAGHAGVVVFS